MDSKKTVVLSLGGSAIVPDDINVPFLKGFKEMITDFIGKGNRVIIVCGGGRTARKYIEGITSISDAPHDDMDWLGIYATRINALLVKTMFDNLAYEEIIIDPSQKITTDKLIIIASGWKPGFSTDMDAVILAEQFNAEEVLNISNIDYVYDKDPKQHPDAEKLETISWQDFVKIVGDTWKPGLNMPFDPIASKKAMELKLKVKILNMDLDNISKCINDEKFKGTTIN